MAVKIEDIDNAKKLEEYLKGKPKELAQVVASRNALRVLPVAQSLYSSEYKFKNLIMQSVFRYNYISWAIRNNQAQNIKFLHFNRNGVANPVFLSLNPAELKENIIKDEITNYSRDASAAAAFSVNSGMNSMLISVSSANAAFGFFSKGAETFYWNYILSDLQTASQAREFKLIIDAPLWGNRIPAVVSQNWNLLKENLLAQDPNWQVWTDWYGHVLQGADSPKLGVAALSNQTLDELAQKPDEFWNREPEDVNAEIAGWVEEAEKLEEWMNEESNIGEPEMVEDKKTEPSSSTNYSKSEIRAVISAVKTNKESIALSSASALLLISDYREKVRVDNKLEYIFREELMLFLDTLRNDLEGLSDLTQILISEPTEENAKNTLNWLENFKSRFNANCKIYIEPENVADATLPAGIILTCASISGAVCGVIGGPLAGISGFGAGTYLGKVITGVIKPSKVFDRLNESLQGNDDKKDAE